MDRRRWEHRKTSGVSEPKVLLENIPFFQYCHVTDGETEAGCRYDFSNSLCLVGVPAQNYLDAQFRASLSTRDTV